jgi:OOP family OmpA-OmpF porin
MRVRNAFGMCLAFILGGCAHPVPGPNPAAESVQAPPDVALATQPKVAAILEAVGANQIVVSFPLGVDRLTPDANRQLDLAARLFRDANPVLMFVSGHSDNSGSEYANLVISARRAQSVKEALVKRGIPANRLLLQALGQSEPLNAADQSSPADRRVVVTWRLL